MVTVPVSPLGTILSRRASALVAEALTDTRVVLINGARQCGKSTLAAQLARSLGASWFTLDRAETRNAAFADPTAFVRQSLPMVIDEIQRVPDLLLAIKERVDAEPRPGSYLLTGSARLLGMRTVPDSLPGRMETVELWPLSQGEIDSASDGFIDAAFANGDGLHHNSELAPADYLERLVRGGFPEAVARQGKRRSAFHRQYVADLVNRDVRQLSEIDKGRQMRELIQLVAARNGQLLVPGNLANDLTISRPTVENYLALLEQVFLIKRIPAWSRNIDTRTIGTAKVAFVDSGVAASLLGEDAQSLTRPGGHLGGLLEGFVAMELARQATWSQQEVSLYHYRTRDKVEVDLVLQNLRGQVVGIEVKAGMTIRSDDFAGLRHLASRLGDDFVAGYVLNLGDQSLPFGSKMRSLPVSAIWETAAA